MDRNDEEFMEEILNHFKERKIYHLSFFQSSSTQDRLFFKKFTFSTLRGNDYDRMLRACRPSELIPGERGILTENLWRKFLHLHLDLKDAHCDQIEELQRRIEDFILDFTGEKPEHDLLSPSARKEQCMYGGIAMTPYMHMLLDHFTETLQNVGSMDKLSLQQLENQNQKDQRSFRSCTNMRRNTGMSVNRQIIQKSCREKIFQKEKVRYRCSFHSSGCSNTFANIDGAPIQKHEQNCIFRS
jgi:hypothetical protein